jgi:predicted alpha/beta-fold hydrolase
MTEFCKKDSLNIEENNEKDEDYNNHFRKIVTSFPAYKFRATNAWVSNEHYQTIVGSGALAKMFFGEPKRPFQTTTEIFDTPDGDQFEVDYTVNINESDSVVIIMHGLESSNKGNLVTKFATAFLEKDFACALFSFRGCSGTPPRYGMYPINPE